MTFKLPTEEDFDWVSDDKIVHRDGASVVPGTKAIFIKGQGNRRDADVIVCTRYYCSYP